MNATILIVNYKLVLWSQLAFIRFPWRNWNWMHYFFTREKINFRNAENALNAKRARRFGASAFYKCWKKLFCFRRDHLLLKRGETIANAILIKVSERVPTYLYRSHTMNLCMNYFNWNNSLLPDWKRAKEKKIIWKTSKLLLYWIKQPVFSLLFLWILFVFFLLFRRVFIVCTFRLDIYIIPKCFWNRIALISFKRFFIVPFTSLACNCNGKIWQGKQFAHNNGTKTTEGKKSDRKMQCLFKHGA